MGGRAENHWEAEESSHVILEQAARKRLCGGIKKVGGKIRDNETSHHPRAIFIGVEAELFHFKVYHPFTIGNRLRVQKIKVGNRASSNEKLESKNLTHATHNTPHSHPPWDTFSREREEGYGKERKRSFTITHSAL